MRLALYHPQIPQNTGSLMRFCACMEIGLDIIHPIGFILDDKRLLRSSMDYAKHLDLRAHNSFEEFCGFYKNNRIIALDINEHARNYAEFEYRDDDVLIAGTEAFGFKPDDKALFKHFVYIPIKSGLRSLNLAIASSVVASHAKLQITNAAAPELAF